MNTVRKLYLVAGQDMGGSLLQFFGKVVSVMKDEEPECSVENINQESAAKLQLSLDDVQFDANITEYDHGSQFIRYVLTFLTWFGVGACKLRVQGTLRRGSGGSETLNLYAMQRLGLFGGTGDALMQQNMNTIAQTLIRKITGKKILNVQAYQFATISLIFGLLGLIPYVGCLLTPIGIGFGLTSLAVILQRDLPKRRTLAIIALVVNVLSIILSFAFIYLLSTSS